MNTDEVIRKIERTKYSVTLTRKPYVLGETDKGSKAFVMKWEAVLPAIPGEPVITTNAKSALIGTLDVIEEHERKLAEQTDQ